METRHNLQMTRRITLVLALLVFAGAALAKPNFSGQWKINGAKSSYGQFPVPEKYDRKIVHDDPKLEISTTQSGFGGQGDFTLEAKYTTDGKESSNPGFGGGAMKGTAKWDGDTLVIESVLAGQNGEIKFVEKWTLSADGKTIEMSTKGSGGFGEFDFKTVLEKQ